MDRAASGSTAPLWEEVDDEIALERYRSLAALVSEGIYQLDASGRFVAVDDDVVELSGYSREKLLGEHVSEVFGEKQGERIEDEIRTACEQEEPTGTVETALETAEGDRLPCELGIRPLVEDGEFRGSLGVVRDRSETDSSERADAETYAPLSPVLEEANVGVFVLDEAFTVAQVNATAERYFGLDREDVIGTDKRQLIHDRIRDRFEDPEEFADTVVTTYEDNSYIEQFECHVTPAEDREERWLEHYSKPIETGAYAGGRIELYSDITDRKRSETERKESEARFQTLVDAVEEYAIFRLDPDGYVTSWNEGAKQIKGYESEEIIGEHFSTFYTPSDRASDVPKRNLEAATTTGSLEDEGWRRRKDGSRFWANVTITPIWDDDGTHRGFLKMTRDLTERHEREQELETELERIFGRISDAFYAVDSDCKFTHVNERAEQVLDTDREELLGTSLWEAFPELEDTVFERQYREAMATQESVSVEEYYPPSDAWFEVHVYPSESGLSVYFRDVTGRVERERELERMERRFEAIFEDPNILVGLLDPDGTVIDINQTAMEYVDADLSDVTGEPFWKTPWWGEDDAVQSNIRRWTERAADGEYVDFETDLTRPDGEQYTLSGYFRPVTNDEGDVVSIIVSDRDISERKRRERQLERSEQRYRTLAENFPNGIVTMFDDDLRYTLAAGRGFEKLPTSPDEVEGNRVRDVWPDEMADRLAAALRDALEGESRTVEAEYAGREWVIHTVPISGDGEVFGGLTLAQDITDRKEYQRELERSNERLEQFAYVTSHDLQEPLRMVSSYLQLLEDRYSDELDEDGEEFIEFAVDGAERMREMINGLLEYSRVETEGSPLEPVELEDVLEDVLEDLRLQIEETDAEISAEPLPTVEGDASQLRQLFQNLLSNALEYSGDDRPRVHIEAERDGGRWVVSVRDEGIGIDPDHQDRIFEVFQRLHSNDEHPGTGIGLALCQRIVDRHGGEIRVESEPGAGSTFVFTLPTAE